MNLVFWKSRKGRVFHQETIWCHGKQWILEPNILQIGCEPLYQSLGSSGPLFFHEKSIEASSLPTNLPVFILISYTWTNLPGCKAWHRVLSLECQPSICQHPWDIIIHLAINPPPKLYSFIFSIRISGESSKCLTEITLPFFHSTSNHLKKEKKKKGPVFQKEKIAIENKMQEINIY